MKAEQSTLRALVQDINSGFAIYVPILIGLDEELSRSYDDETEQTSIMSLPLEWSNKFTHEYADESFLFVGKNDFQGGLDTPVTIGRSRTCDVCLDRESVSKVHATIAFVRQKGGIFYR